MVREITTHTVNPANERLQIVVLDEPGSGGAHHEYEVRLLPELHAEDQTIQTLCKISFQNGPIKEAGVNGLTQEVLLAIVQDRLECFQAGPYACDPNQVALQKVREAKESLLERTRERMARNVEGTHTV